MNKQTNFKIFVDTIRNLASSRGFYCRLLNQLNSMTDEELTELKNNLPKFKGYIDVIFYLEQ